MQKNFVVDLSGEEDAPEEGAGEQADNEPDSEDAAPKGGVNIFFLTNGTLELSTFLF